MMPGHGANLIQDWTSRILAIPPPSTFNIISFLPYPIPLHSPFKVDATCVSPLKGIIHTQLGKIQILNTWLSKFSKKIANNALISVLEGTHSISKVTGVLIFQKKYKKSIQRKSHSNVRPKYTFSFNGLHLKNKSANPFKKVHSATLNNEPLLR